MPTVVRNLLTRAYIPYRKIVENLEANKLNRRLVASDTVLRVVYLSGFPRTGSTVLKYYFSDFPGLVMNPFDPAGFFVAWLRAQTIPRDQILIDKSNHYIQSPEVLFHALGRHAALCVIVRDPRDSLLSLQTFSGNSEVPRGMGFWDYWSQTYGKCLEFASSTEFGDRVFFLRYEDFVSYPSAAKHAYLEWLGLDASTAEVTNRYPLPDRREFRIDKVHAESEIRADGLQRWKEFAGSSEVADVINGWRHHEEARRIMQQLGYGPDNIGPLSIDHGNFTFFVPTLRSIANTGDNSARTDFG